MNIAAKVILLIALLVGLTVIIYAGIYYIHFYTRGYFVCVKCGKKFHPPLWKLVFSLHVLNEILVVCPYCGAKEYVELKLKQKNKKQKKAVDQNEKN